MRLILVLLCVQICSACNGPSLALRGAIGKEVDVQGSTFIVYHQGIRVEVVRTNFEFPANVRRIFPKAAVAIEQVTGCPPHLATLTGDAALIKGDLNCGDHVPNTLPATIEAP